MKKIFLLSSFGFLISWGLFGQTKRYSYEPKLAQVRVGGGFINSNLNLEFRINSKTTTSVDFGIGMVYFLSNYYNKFNENYADYFKSTGDFLNLGEIWWSPYTSVQLRRIISSRSKTLYESTPYANTFSYLGLQFKYAGREFYGWVDRNQEPFRETYQIAVIIGRQLELGKDSPFIWDIYIGFGTINNYKFDAVESQTLLSTKLSLRLWSMNK